MIFDTNFLQGRHRAERWLRRGAQVALLLAGASAFPLAMHQTGLHAEAEALDGALERVEGELVRAEQEYGMRMEKLPDGIGSALASLSSLPTHKGTSTASLLYQLEKLLPRQMHLSQLRHDRVTGAVTLEARTRDGASVPELLKKLEQVDGIAAVRMLGRESAEDGAVVVRISFTQAGEDSGV